MLAASTVADAAPDVGFTVSPTNINSTIAIGDQTNETVTLKNSSTNEIIVRGHVSGSAGEADPVISLMPEEVTLKPGGSEQIVVHINVPTTTETGRRLSSVLFEAASSSVIDVSIVGQVGVVIGMDIIRPVSEVKWSFPRIIDSSDQVIFQMEGRNTGNFTTSLQGTADISGIFEGNNIIQAASDPIAIGETAYLQANWDETPLISIKRVTLHLGSGIGAPVEKKAMLIIFPWKLTLMLLVMLATAAAGAHFQPHLAKVLSRNGRRVD